VIKQRSLCRIVFCTFYLIVLNILSLSQLALSQTTLNGSVEDLGLTKNLIQNGHFEESTPMMNHSGLTPQSLSLKYWLVHSTLLEYFASNLPEEAGNHYIGIKSTTEYNGISQMIKTAAGRKYNLSFMLKETDICPSPMPLGVLVNGNLHKYSIGNGSTWLPYTIEFVARSNTSLIEFIGLESTPTPCMTALDNVSVIETRQNIPNDFEGDWQTTWGVLTIKMNGQRLTGTYPHDQGRIDGTVSEDGTTFTGTWSEAPSYSLPNDAGPLVLRLSQDKSSFDGQWGDFKETKQFGWTGKRIEVSKPVSIPIAPSSSNKTPEIPVYTKPTIRHTVPKHFEGDWQTTWGVMTIKMNGQRLTGTYPHDQGRIEGTVSEDGTTFTGTWSEAPSYSPPNDAGPVIFKLSADKMTFEGHYGQQSKQYNWTGKRIEVSKPVSIPVAPSSSNKTPETHVYTKPTIRHTVPKQFEGDWQTTWGVLTFKMNGRIAKGYYTHDQGRIEGMVSEDGRTFTGTWSEAPSYSPPHDAGKMILRLSPDQRTFSGKWGYGNKVMEQNWQGTRIQY
jgi:hypothetical protein